ncbi:hypothetical protein BLNAU_8674 [Blattamonas nauphoetae]|uniref:Uncharacterized protein n=1 Tax=Blattamonas nauphoetae TaxID=2049346 RepID=A0ABQ9XXR9_9EUKA|nr:hypothetical protein BLNAU_8674 [Blattamonas nauphoetae]
MEERFELTAKATEKKWKEAEERKTRKAEYEEVKNDGSETQKTEDTDVMEELEDLHLEKKESHVDKRTASIRSSAVYPIFV